jgi:hypothetical protein
MPKVVVTVSDTTTGLQRKTVTDSAGQFQLAGLSPSSYDVTVETSGFATDIRKGRVASVGQTAIADFQMKPSQVSTVIEVMDQPFLVETERGSQANSIDHQHINELPISRRDYLTFTLLMPGVSNSIRLTDDQDFRVKQTPQSGLSFYGSNGRGNSVTVDGGEVNDDEGDVRLTMSHGCSAGVPDQPQQLFGRARRRERSLHQHRVEIRQQYSKRQSLRLLAQRYYGCPRPIRLRLSARECALARAAP